MGSAEGLRQSPGGEWRGVTLKTICLVTLTVQNSALILILYYSRTMPLVGGHRYFTSTAVFLNEVQKLAICSTVALYDISRQISPTAPATSLFTNLFSAVFTGDSWKLAIPATLYTLQNSLQYFAVSHLEAATLQVTYQFKILPTAIFSILILGRSLTVRQWLSLLLLMVGVAIVQIPIAQPTMAIPVPLKDSHSHWHLSRALVDAGHTAMKQLTRRSATYEGIEEDMMRHHPPRNELMGLLAALGSCTVAALGSVYFEKIVKDSTSNVGIWTRNVQLSVYSLFPAFFVGVLFVDGENIARYGFFTGYNWVVWLTITCQATGGIIVSLCVYYADTVAKSFATSISILLSLCLSMLFFDFNITMNFLVGTSVVLYATYLYNSEEYKRRPTIKISENEKSPIDHSFTIKLPSTPLRESALTTSTPGSPALHHTRTGSSHGYFGTAKKE